MWKLKACTRCGADVFVERDEYGWYEQCLQCGCIRDLDVAELREQPAEREQEPAVVR